MSIKPGRIGEQIKTNELGKLKVKNPAYVAGSAGTYIEAGAILTVTGIDGAYLEVTEAQDGTTDENILCIASHQIRDFGTVVGWYIQEAQDTSAGAQGDSVYLSDATPGEWVITAPAGSPIAVGKILVDSATVGVVILGTPSLMGNVV